MVANTSGSLDTHLNPLVSSPAALTLAECSLLFFQIINVKMVGKLLKRLDNFLVLACRSVGELNSLKSTSATLTWASFNISANGYTENSKLDGIGKSFGCTLGDDR
ncbi:hypothetical protein TNCV_2656711 [Trichonephila clavipes]|nr:hypothetical protein TNCV_2656711 [Trichonephila clavipes]